MATEPPSSRPADTSVRPESVPPAEDRAAPPGDRVDLTDTMNALHWCEHFGVTREQLEEAIKAAGDSPAAVREHLLNQGSSAGAS
jgi:uncharacterized protein DUF3606